MKEVVIYETTALQKSSLGKGCYGKVDMTFASCKTMTNDEKYEIMARKCFKDKINYNFEYEICRKITDLIDQNEIF